MSIGYIKAIHMASDRISAVGVRCFVTNAGWLEGAAKSFFVVNSNGVKTNRDAWVYNFSRANLAENMTTTIDYYNMHEPTEVDTKKTHANHADG